MHGGEPCPGLIDRHSPARLAALAAFFSFFDEAGAFLVSRLVFFSLTMIELAFSVRVRSYLQTTEAYVREG
jgi:hypothetical protein